MVYTLNSGDTCFLREVLSREYEVRECCGESKEALNEAVRLLHRPGEIDTALSRDQLSSAVRLLSHGENDVIYDEEGLPSIMVRIPALHAKDVLSASSTDALHPAFMAGQNGVWVGKYQMSMLHGHACSLPMVKPRNGVSFDEARRLCNEKGPGWCLMPFALRMAIALSCRKHGFLPHGNNSKGQEYLHPEEKGLPVDDGQTLCGSGPAAWSHNGTANGIRDLNGNLNEWDAGFRLMNGEIQLIPICDLFKPEADLSLDSPLWKAMDETGELVPPGSPETLKYDAQDGGVRLTRTIKTHGVGNCAYAQIQAESGLEPPEAARMFGLCPEALRDGYGNGWRWIATEGEVLPLCGGGYWANDHAGVFFVGTTYPRTKDYALTGFRACYHD
jgi:hypothetical protein